MNIDTIDIGTEELEKDTIDISSSDLISDEDSSVKAAMAVIANDSLSIYEKPDPDVDYESLAEQKFEEFYTSYSNGNGEAVEGSLAKKNLDQVKLISQTIYEDALAAGDTKKAKEVVDLTINTTVDGNTDTIIEEKSSQSIVERGMSDADRAAVAEQNEFSYEDRVQQVVEGGQYTNKQIQHYMNKLDFDWDTVGEALINFVPEYSTFFNSQVIKTEVNPLLSGNDLAEQKATWDAMSLKQKSVTAKQVNAIFEEKDNDLNALMWWSYMADMGTGSVWLENAITITDGVAVAYVPVQIIKSINWGLRLGRVVELFARGKIATVTAAAGNRADAAEAVKVVIDKVETGTLSKLSNAAEEAADLSVDSQLLIDPDLAVNLSGRLVENLKRIDKLTDDFLNTPSNSYLSESEKAEALIVARKEGGVEGVRTYPMNNKQPIDIDRAREGVDRYLGVTKNIATSVKGSKIVDDIVGNPIYRVTYGAEEGRGFSSAEIAQAAAEQMRLDGAVITTVEEGAGTFFIHIDKPISKASDYIAAYNTTDISSGGGIRRWMANTLQLVSKTEQRAAHLTLATREGVTNVGKQLIKNVHKLKHNEKIHLGEVLEEGRNNQKWFNLSELKYDKKLNDKQITAYHALRQMDDIDHQIDNALRYGRLDREGYKSIEVTSKFSVSKEIGEFNGKIELTIKNPSNKSIFNASTGKYVTDITEKTLKGLQEKGYKIVSMEGSRDIKGKSPIQFLLVKELDLKVKPINPKQIEYLPGGRIHYSEEYFVKQGRLRVGPGQVPIMISPKTYGVSTKAESAEFVAHMEAGRAVVLAKGSDKALSEATNGRFTTVAEYVSYVGKENLKMPFEMVKDNETLISVNKIISEGKAQALSEDLNMSNSLQRLIRTRGNKQSRRGDRLKDFTGNSAPVINPIVSASKSLDRAVSLMTLETWRDKQIAKFTKTFSEVLDRQKGPSDLAVFLDPQYVNSSDPVIKIKINQAKNMREHFNRILNTKTSGEKVQHSIISGIVDSVAPVLRINPDSLSSKKVKDFSPVEFARYVSFQEKMGLGNLAQPFTQLQTSVLIGTVSNQGAQAIMMAPQIRMMLMSENSSTLGTLAAGLAKIVPGATSNVMKEALEVVTRSGTWRMKAGTLSEQNLNKATTPASWASKLLEVGITPFMESERFNKITATTAAFLEWRKVNKTAKITDDVIDSIRTRGETIALSMNRVDHAAWQRGIMGGLTQFWGYQARLAESFLPVTIGGSKNFTNEEKWRIALGQLALYGVGGTVGGRQGLRFKEYIRAEYNSRFDEPIDEQVLETIEGGFVDKVFLAGLGMDVNTHYRTGAGFTESGWGEIFFKIADISNYSDLLKMESAPIETFSQNVGSIAHIFNTLSVVGSDITTKQGFIMATESFADFARRNISSYSRNERAYLAMKNGQFYDRLSGVEATGLSFFEAVGISFGLDPSIVADKRAMQNVIVDSRSMHKKHTEVLVKAMRESFNRSDPALFDYAKTRILNSVDDIDDRVEIMQKVLNTVKNNKEDRLFMKWIKMFGPDSIKGIQ